MPLVLLAKCPEPRLEYETRQQVRLSQRVSEFARCANQAGVDSSFGMELRAAYLLEKEHAGALKPPEGTPPYRQFFLRPAIEPILYSYRDSLRVGSLDANIVDEMMACLHGHPVQRRTCEARISPNAQGNFVRFPDWEYAQDYCARLNRHLPSMSGALNRAGYAYAEVLLSHPYADGNGRLARAIAVTCLARDIGAPVPFLPLGPAFYAHASAVANALQTLAATSDWASFMSVFSDFVEEALALAERVLDAERMVTNSS